MLLDQRGSSNYAQTLILIGVLALGGIAGVRVVRSALDEKATCVGGSIMSLGTGAISCSEAGLLVGGQVDGIPASDLTIEDAEDLRRVVEEHVTEGSVAKAGAASKGRGDVLRLVREAIREAIRIGGRILDTILKILGGLQALGYDIDIDYKNIKNFRELIDVNKEGIFEELDNGIRVTLLHPSGLLSISAITITITEISDPGGGGGGGGNGDNGNGGGDDDDNSGGGGGDDEDPRTDPPTPPPGGEPDPPVDPPTPPPGGKPDPPDDDSSTTDEDREDRENPDHGFGEAGENPEIGGGNRGEDDDSSTTDDDREDREDRENPDHGFGEAGENPEIGGGNRGEDDDHAADDDDEGFGGVGV